ncbi:50S ribosomal protein L11 [Candidatus Woesearchaeota archaeon]|jgi:large subunit ribosomal protein L11|nr:50S ribosomal protein L11 [Candidatus Woesearchaeota archaeon]MBT6044903.1 50S ribosomal protein L11 [Candidatus Woesearchaeota archaeon]
MVKIKLMIEGGKASTSPAMAQTLGPLKMDMQGILKDINEKTETYKGLKVPVELDVNEKDKTYDITVKSPPASELIKSELKIKKGSGEPEKKKVGNISIEQLLKVAKMKSESLFTTNIKSAIKAVAGTCNSLGVLVEGVTSNVFNGLLEEGKFDDTIKSGNTELDPEKAKALKEQLDAVQSEMDKAFAKKKAKGAKEAKPVKEEAPAGEGEEAKAEEEKKVEEKK